MKKFLMIAVAAMAVASQAASVQWQLSSSSTADGYALGQTALLFVARAGDTFSYGGTDDLSLADYVNALLADGTDKATEKAFDSATTKASRTGSILTDAKTKDVTYAAGSDIVGMIVVLDGNGKYSSFSFATKVAGNGPTQLPTSNASSNSGGFVDLPGGGSQIPEPATGALALAGLALLFKRRRA